MPYGDASLVNNWMKNAVQLQNNILLSLSMQIKEIATHFQEITFTRIFRELSTKADSLLKKGLQLQEDQISM